MKPLLIPKYTECNPVLHLHLKQFLKILLMLIRSWTHPSAATVSVWPADGDNSRVSTFTEASPWNTSGINVQQLSKQKLHWKIKKKRSSGCEFYALRYRFCFNSVRLDCKFLLLCQQAVKAGSLVSPAWRFPAARSVKWRRNWNVTPRAETCVWGQQAV